MWWPKEDRFLVRVCLNCIELRHGCVVKNIVFLGENAHFSEMPRCLVAPMLSLLSSRIDADLEAFWSSKVASKWHLQAIGNGMDRSIDFGMHLGAILPPTWVPLGSIWASVGPHWAPSWPHLGLIGPRISTPLGPCQLHEHLTRAHLSSS